MIAYTVATIFWTWGFEWQCETMIKPFWSKAVVKAPSAILCLSCTLDSTCTVRFNVIPVIVGLTAGRSLNGSISGLERASHSSLRISSIGVCHIDLHSDLAALCIQLQHRATTGMGTQNRPAIESSQIRFMLLVNMYSIYSVHPSIFNSDKCPFSTGITASISFLSRVTFPLSSYILTSDSLQSVHCCVYFQRGDVYIWGTEIVSVTSFSRNVRIKAMGKWETKERWNWSTSLYKCYLIKCEYSVASSLTATILMSRGCENKIRYCLCPWWQLLSACAKIYCTVSSTCQIQTFTKLNC